MVVLSGDESAFPRLGSTGLDARQKTPETVPQDSRQQRVDIESSLTLPGAASSAPQAMLSAIKTPALLDQVQSTGGVKFIYSKP